jgi:DNA-binding MarR family transcriptional regulator
LLEVVIERETPILAAHELTMWEYIVLASISSEPGLSQSELAQLSRRDSTRLIRHLDDLVTRELVVRDIDPGDRRRRVVRLTHAGSARLGATQEAIRAMEAELLRALPESEQQGLRSALATSLRSVASGKPPTDSALSHNSSE